MLNCTKCNASLSSASANTDSLVACGACGSLLRVDVFPAINRALPVGRAGATIQVDTEAGCFYHARKKAIIPCSTCGRFLCDLCDVSLNGSICARHVLRKARSTRKLRILKIIASAMIQLPCWWQQYRC